MIKKVKHAILIVLIISSSFVFGCAKRIDDENVGELKDNKLQQTDPAVTGKENVELKIWSWFTIKDMLKQFESKNKGITVKEELFDFSKCNEEYMKALADGTGPDILVFDSGFFGQYTIDGALQDLLEEPFSADKYKNDFWGWYSGFSVNKKQLLSLTYSTAPYVTIYRADIMKENGFPSEPEEFGKFIEKPENILLIGNKLKKQDKYIFQYPTDLTDLVGASLGFFDDNFTYTRTTDLFVEALDLGRTANSNDLISHKNFWQDTGKKAIQENKLVMFSLASYTMSTLEGYVPEQKGKWRVTKAPLGVAACGSDTRLSINSQSSHKKEAWKLLEYIVTHTGEMVNVVPGYIPAMNDAANMSRKEPFFGDQVVYPILKDLTKNMTQHKLTPLDSDANEIYIKCVWESLINTDSSKAEIEIIRKKVEDVVAEEKKALLE